MSEKDGGPAFPVPNYVNAQGETYESTPRGMSLRDWFAGQALAGILADPNCDPIVGDSLKELAHGAYACADAMLKAREDKPHE